MKWLLIVAIVGLIGSSHSALEQEAEGLSPAELARTGNTPKEITFVPGQTYHFGAKGSCLCGGGERRSADPYVKILYSEDGETFRQIAESRSIDNSYIADWGELFGLKYNDGVTQYVKIEVWDDDTFQDDYLGESKTFLLYGGNATVISEFIESGAKGELEPCFGPNDKEGCSRAYVNLYIVD